MNNTFTTISYNIWFEEYLTTERTNSLIKIINESNPDVICLQEVRPNIHTFLIHNLENYKYHYPEKLSKSYGCITFSKYPITKCLEYEFENSTMGRSLIITKIDHPYNKTEIVVTNTHFESLFNKKYINKPKIKQFEETSLILEGLYTEFKNVLLCADTNVLHHEENKFNEFFDNNNWIDSWINRNSNVIHKYTYDSDHNVYLQEKFPNIKYKSRIDRILFKGDNLILEEFSMLKGHDNMIEPSDHFGIISKFIIT